MSTRKHSGRIGIHSSEETLSFLRYQAGIRSTRAAIDGLIAWVTADPGRLAEFRSSTQAEVARAEAMQTRTS